MNTNPTVLCSIVHKILENIIENETKVYWSGVGMVMPWPAWLISKILIILSDLIGSSSLHHDFNENSVILCFWFLCFSLPKFLFQILKYCVMMAFWISIFTMLVKNHEDGSQKMEMSVKDEHFITLLLVGADRKQGFWLIWVAYIKFNWCQDLFSSHKGYKYMLDSYSDSVLITTQRSNDLIIISEVTSHFILYLKSISVII